jgi:hypothetical protein
MSSGPSRDKVCIHVSTRKVLRSRDEFERVGTLVRVHFALRSFTACQLRVHMQSIECSAKHNRGVSEVFHEAARVALTARAASGPYTAPIERDSKCVVM